jgi:hypothetical protein
VVISPSMCAFRFLSLVTGRVGLDVVSFRFFDVGGNASMLVIKCPCCEKTLELHKEYSYVDGQYLLHLVAENRQVLTINLGDRRLESDSSSIVRAP